MSDTEIRMMYYTMEQLSAELQAIRQYVSDIKTEFERTRKTLEQSEICCTEWEKQALDYKAENIALSGDLERTRKALDVAIDALNYANKCIKGGCVNWETEIDRALDKITALEQKESAFVHNKIEFPEYNDNLLEEFDKQFFENGQDDDLTETALEQKDVK